MRVLDDDDDDDNQLNPAGSGSSSSSSSSSSSAATTGNSTSDADLVFLLSLSLQPASLRRSLSLFLAVKTIAWLLRWLLAMLVQRCILGLGHTPASVPCYPNFLFKSPEDSPLNATDFGLSDFLRPGCSCKYSNPPNLSWHCSQLFSALL
ncbi:hypothetical protein L1987_11782 [Smallanthus sonchifolius]|uniref:Uncharacterized protein n=1 Tax=Smallanthus sonchifolius TaxID=185202 RepID=A0ACB9JCG9_9ASTR|nr:hypothetical protein L1987_11782 [Smallanthus sonchifolius]